MLDCDGWQYATAYHDAFTSTVLGHPVAAVTNHFGGIVNVTFERLDDAAEKVVREALGFEQWRRARLATCLLRTARAHMGAEV